MPAVSAKQKRLMDAAAHNPEFAEKVGVPTDVAKEFSAASKGKNFGPANRADLQGINKPKTDHGKSALFSKGGAMKMGHSEKSEIKSDKAQDKAMIKKAIGQHDKQLHGGKKTHLALKKGGMPHAFNEKKELHRVDKELKMNERDMRESPSGKTSARIRNERDELRRVDSRLNMNEGMAKGGFVKSADGCAQRGKTKGRMI